MNNIFPIDVPLTIVWHLSKPDGTEFSLEGYSYRLFYKNGKGKAEADSTLVTADNNTISFVFPADEPRFVGEYSLQLVLFQNGRVFCTLNYNNAFGFTRLGAIGERVQNQEGTGFVAHLYTVAEYYLFSPVIPTVGSDGYWYVSGEMVTDGDGNPIPSSHTVEYDPDTNLIIIDRGRVDAQGQSIEQTITVLAEVVGMGEADHQRAEDDHYRAEHDHDRADEDHDRANADHDTAVDDHDTLGSFKEDVINFLDSYRPIVIEGDVVNAPDEEDITMDENDLLKFKNRDNLHGRGYFIVRSGASLASQMTLANTTYEIRYNFDLGGNTLNIPRGCVLNFVGGKIAGTGTVNGNDTIIKGDAVCFGENIIMAGTWGNETIFTKWFDFKASNDGVTDNVLCFKQLESVINGTNGCKVEFEPGYYQTSIPNKTGAGKVTIGGVEYTKWITNDGPIWNPDDTVMFIKNIPYVDINLNGSEIHAINVFCPKWACFLFRSIDNAKLHDGKIFGVAGPSFAYPEYANHANTVVRKYEFPSLIFQQGGYCDFYNLTVSNSEGDGITVGTGSKSLGGDLYEYFYAKGYRVSGCEIMYCGRNGVVVHSSGGSDDETEPEGREAIPGVLEQLYIHNIGSDLSPADEDSGKIGSDGVMGFDPRAGIDFEFEDGAKGKPVILLDTISLEKCARRSLTFARDNSLMKQFHAKNLMILGPVVPYTENLTADGDKVFEGCYFRSEYPGQLIGEGVVYDNCIFDIKSPQFNTGKGVFKNCTFIDNTDGSSLQLLGQNSSPGEYYNCRFKLHSAGAYVSCKTFRSCHFELSGITKRLYIGGAKFFDCEMVATEASGNLNWSFLIGNVPGDFFFKGCTIKNILGINTSGSGSSLVLNSTSAILDDCLIDGDFSIGIYKNAYAKKLFIQGCSFMNTLIMQEFVPSGVTEGESNEIIMRHSTIAGVFTPHAFTNSKVKGILSNLSDIGPQRSRSGFCILYGCVVDGITEAQYTAYGGQGKGNTFIAE